MFIVSQLIFHLFFFSFYLCECVCVEMLTMQSLISDGMNENLWKMVEEDDFTWWLSANQAVFISLYHPIEIEYQQKMQGITSSGAIKCTL